MISFLSWLLGIGSTWLSVAFTFVSYGSLTCPCLKRNPSQKCDLEIPAVPVSTAADLRGLHFRAGLGVLLISYRRRTLSLRPLRTVPPSTQETGMLPRCVTTDGTHTARTQELKVSILVDTS